MRAKACVVFQYFDFDGKSEILKSKKPSVLLNKNANFNKAKQNRKWGSHGISRIHLERQT